MSNINIHISVVSPVYESVDSIQELTDRIVQIFKKLDISYEIILVNDGSKDNSWEKIVQVAQNDARIKGINLSRNFGQHYAIHAGLAHTNGEWIVVMDCDLQDQPEEIEHLINKSKEGYDIVYAVRKDRNDSSIKKLSSKFFYSIFNSLADVKHNSDVANFGIYNQRVIKAILSMNDHIKYFPAMTRWVGFNSSSIYVDHQARFLGESSYNVKSLVRLASNNILTFSNKPLRITMRLGLIISFISFFVGLRYLILYLKGEIEVLGFSSIIISIWFLSGLILFFLGIIGLYLGKAFDQVKNRPTYIIAQKLNIGESK